MRRFAPLLVVMATIGCGYDEDTTSSELTGAYWRVTAGLKTAGWEQSPPTVQFTDGGVSGSNGCNQFGATYELSGDRLTIEQHMTTLMYCGSPAWDVELEFSELLQTVAGWRFEGDELVLGAADGKDLLRLREPSVIGSWEVGFVRFPEYQASVIDGTKITAVLGEDGTLTGNAGCNTYETSYTHSRGQLTIAPPVMTSHDTCAEPDGIMEQEQAYLSQLPLTSTYSFSGLTFSLFNSDGATGSFHPAD